MVDVLFEWGSHNTEWRLGRKVMDLADAVEVVLSYYSPLPWRILIAAPIACFRAEFTAEDIPLITIADGRPVTEWAGAVQQGTEHSGRYVREMVSLSTAHRGTSGLHVRRRDR